MQQLKSSPRSASSSAGRTSFGKAARRVLYSVRLSRIWLKRNLSSAILQINRTFFTLKAYSIERGNHALIIPMRPKTTRIPGGPHPIMETTSWRGAHPGGCGGARLSPTRFKAAAGAQLVAPTERRPTLIYCSVQEPIAAEYGRLRPGQILFTFLHLAASRAHR